MTQTAACNGRHAVDERLARWILMARDRVGGDTFPMTHEFLSLMLAVRRSGVTVAMKSLQERDLVRSRRGRILVCDRAGLEAATCECYGRVRAFSDVTMQSRSE